MNAARLAALVLAGSLALAAASGALSTAAAQGPAVDTPSGYGSLTPVTGDPETSTVLGSFTRGPWFTRGIAPGYSPLVPALLGWVPAARFVPAAQAARRPVVGQASRQRTLPAGR